MSPMKSMPSIAFLLVIGVTVGAAGCSWFDKPKSPEDDPLGRAYQSAYDSKAYADTVASEAYYQGLNRLRARGFGLVAGLGQSGSGECPLPVRRQLQKQFSRLMAEVERPGDLGDLTLEKLLTSKDTAIVEVVGEIPAGLTKGGRFDLHVRALPGTQTTSLEGGWLYTCDLRLYRSTRTGGVLEGRAVARGAGPIFVNPFVSPEGPATPNRRAGLVLGGGVVLQDRRVRLILATPSYSMALRIQDRINNRFGADNRVAEAVSPGVVKIDVPPAYHGREKYFVSLITHTFLYGSAGFLDRRKGELIEEMQQPDAPYDDLVMAFVCLGRTVIPALQELYAHRSSRVAFHAARAGLRLGDELAINVLAEHARKVSSPWREQAIRELGASGKPSAGPPLRSLLDGRDQRVRLLAYEALRELGDPTIETRVLGQRNLILDVVDAAGPHMMYARRLEEPRLVLFGRDLRCQPPLFYAFRDQLVTLNADRQADTLTLIRRTPLRRRVSEPIPVSLRVADVVCRLAGDPVPGDGGQVEGVGLVYSQVLEVLRALCDQGAIDAELRLEGTVIPDVWEQAPPLGRKEAEFD